MGIQNLLRELKSITKNRHLSDFNGKTCGVDASCWLHRAAYRCAYQLLMGKNSTKYLDTIENYLSTLKHFGIKAVMVFDGAQLPMKANEEKKRGESREHNRQLAIDAYKNGDKENGYKYATRAIRITSNMVTALINRLRQRNINFVVAPYEADAQLGYMYKKGQIDFVISEDSDLLLFGVRRCLYKLDLSGNKSGQYLDLDEIQNYKPPTASSRKKMDLCYFLKRYKDPMEFIHVCVLSGCDYVNSLYGIGIKTAVKLCTENRKIKWLLQKLKSEKKNCPKDYEIQFERAVLAFMHQTVYDIPTKSLLHLNPLTDRVNEYLERLKKFLSRLSNNNKQQNDNGANPTVTDTTLNFLGPMMENNIARLIAEGKVDARSKKPRDGIVDIVDADNDDNDDDTNGGNRFFAKSKSNKNKQTKNNSNPFQISQNIALKKKNQPNNNYNKKNKNKNRKSGKFFGSFNDDEEEETKIVKNNNNTDDLQTFFTQFIHQDTTKNDENNCIEVEDGLEFDLKENSEIPETDDEDINIEISDNKPIRNRKRKRSEIEVDMFEVDESPSKEYNEEHKPLQRRRKIKHRTPINKNTPRSQFIKKITPKNVQQLLSEKKKSSTDGLFNDLYTPSKYNHHTEDKENINIKNSNSNKKHNQSQSRSRNPFSVNNNNKKSLAMIGAKSKPINIDDTINISDSDTDDDSVNDDVTFLSEKKRKKNSMLLTQLSKCEERIEDDMDNGDNDFYDALDDNETNNELSQSQSEQQIVQTLNNFNILSQNHDIDNKEQPIIIESDEDDDIMILPQKKSEIKQSKKMKNKKFVPKKFKPPRIKDKSKLPISAKNNNKKKSLGIKKNYKNKKKTKKVGKQLNLMTMWKSKT